MWCLYTATILSGCEVAVNVAIALSYSPPYITPGIFAALAGVVTILAGFARLWTQKGLR